MFAIKIKNILSYKITATLTDKIKSIFLKLWLLLFSMTRLRTFYEIIISAIFTDKIKNI